MTQDGEPSTRIVGSTRARASARVRRAALWGSRALAVLAAIVAFVVAAPLAHAGAFELNDTGWEGESELL